MALNLGLLLFVHVHVHVVPMSMFMFMFCCWQALWTQAHENLKVLTIICANNTYAILKVSHQPQALRCTTLRCT
jgi:hypothetical protein